MVYYDNNTVSSQMRYHGWLAQVLQRSKNESSNFDSYVYKKVVDLFSPLFQKDDLVCYGFHATIECEMPVVVSLYALLDFAYI